jgi:hypothetical protein
MDGNSIFFCSEYLMPLVQINRKWCGPHGLHTLFEHSGTPYPPYYFGRLKLGYGMKVQVNN